MTIASTAATDNAFADINRHLRIASRIAGAHYWRYDLPELKLAWSENAGAELRDFQILKRSSNLMSALWNTLHPDDAERIRQRLMDPECDHGTIEYRRVAADGSVRHIRAAYQSYKHENGTSSHVIGSSQDVTHEIEVTEQLQQQAAEMKALHDRLERAAQSSQEGHWEADFATGKHWCSDVYRELLGYGPDHDFTTMATYQAICHPDELEGQYHMVMALKDGEAYERTIRLKHADGTWRWMQVRGTLERDAHGQPVRLTGNIRSVHEQTLMQTQLDEYQSRFSRAINGTQDGLWELNLNTHELWLSPRCAEILGYTAIEVVQWNEADIARITHQDDRLQLKTALDHARDNGTSYDLEYRMQVKSGHWIWVNVRGKATMDDNGKAISLSGSLQDVTAAHVAREKLIKATAEAESANKAKSAFLANMSHELRTPMNGIIGMAQLLAGTPLNETQREFAEIITSSANSLLAIINDVLDLSKVEASKLSIECVELELRDTIDEIANMMTKQLAEKGVEFVVDVEPDLPERVKGDPHRIRQCVLNLLNNAYKFTQRGQVVLTVRRSTNEPGMMEFSVSDTGIGITQETITRLFRPFVQADSSTTRRFGGTGLGLSIVKRLIELMGGEIGVSSVPDRGSRFWFTLPLLTGTNVIQKAQPARNQNIMLIERNDARRDTLIKQLAFMGFKVTAAASVTTALPMLRQAAAEKQTFAYLIVNEELENLQSQLLNHQNCTDLQLHNTPCLILCKITRKQKADALAGILSTRVLCEPAKYRELYKIVTSRPSREATASAPVTPALQPGTVEDKPTTRLPGEVLLVEDNIVNQKVAIRFLQRLGAKVTVANNGAEGVELLKRGRFALVLMDVQMPVMDGFEATHCIRALESKRRTVPIVALTANAMPEDRDNCLKAGMNEFLTKPLQIDKLTPLVNQYCANIPEYDDATTLTELQVNTILSAETSTKPSMASPQVDLNRLNMVVGDDRSFLTELVDAYVQTAREVIGELKTALDSNDTDTIARSAHKLKGASSNMCIMPVSELASTLEKKAPELNTMELRSMINTLDQSTATAINELMQAAHAQQPAA